MEGFPLLLLFLILWLVDRFLGAAVRFLHGARSAAKAVERGDVTVEMAPVGAGQLDTLEEQQSTTMTEQR